MQMLADHPSVTTIPTRDLDRARGFYEQTLGFKPTREMPEMGMVAYETPNGSILLYASEFAGTNQATAMSFEIPPGAFDAELSSLRGAGVTFDTFDLPETTWEDGVARLGDQRAAWFKDPDGNIISVATAMP
jgi:catechol 2,3-dioxygenase-like lactoylglutathione lyase family enzyme